MNFESRRPPAIALAPWAEDDLALLVGLNALEMTEHLGGPEGPDQVRERLRRYVAARQSETSYPFKIVVQPEAIPAGFVGFWDREWRGETVYEMGWSVLPEHQGRGIAATATGQAVDLARATSRRAAIHAFPSVDNAPSNGICSKLGFELLGSCEFEYPKGHWMRCNDWRLRL
jgi:RimJ/RimL family protein N-acetyltransferase